MDGNGLNYHSKQTFLLIQIFASGLSALGVCPYNVFITISEISKHDFVLMQNCH